MRVGLIAGDGIGPEVIAGARVVLEATRRDIDFVELSAGKMAYEATGSALPAETLATARSVDAVLKGPMEVPLSGYASPNQGLRKALGAHANIRSVRYFPHRGVSRYPGLNLTIIRDITEDLTMGASQTIGDGIAGVALKVVSRASVERLARLALDYATRHESERVTITHLAPSQRDTDGIFLAAMQAVAEQEYPEIHVDDEAIDPLVVHLVQDPTRYQVLVSPNLYGGILCGLLAGLAGSVGLMPGANLGGEVPIFEAGHGTAPRYAGRGSANPVGSILSAAMMLGHLGDTDGALTIENAVSGAIADGMGTVDIGGGATTTEFSEDVASRCARTSD